MSSPESNRDPLMDDDEDEVLVPPSSAKDAPDDLELKKIWDSQWICQVIVDGKKKWRCLHCNLLFPQWNATKALAHVTGTTGQSIAVCHGKISPSWKMKYKDLEDRNLSRKAASALRKQQFFHHFQIQDNKVLNTQLERKGQERKMPPLVMPPVAAIPPVAAMPPSGKPLPKVASNQMILTGRPYNKDPHCVQIGRNKLARAIFGNGVQFRFINDPEFREAVEYIATIHPDQWSWCDRKELSGNILNDMYQTQLRESYDSLKKDCKTCGFCMMGDGATIKKVPLINIMAQAGGDHPLPLEIVDCSSRMASGKTKDAYYISSLFQRHIIIIGKENGDLIIFDGASNVQKAGRLLSVPFPMLTCIHDPAHCIHLVFGDVFKLLPISLMCKFYRRVYFWCQGPHHVYTSAYNTVCDACPESHTRLIKLSTIRFGIFIGCFIRLCRNKKPTLTFMSMSDSIRPDKRKRGVPMDLRRIMNRDEYWQAHHMICKFTGPLSLALRWADRKGPGMHMLLYLCIRAEETMLTMMDEVNRVLFLKGSDKWKGSVFEDMEKFLGSRESDLKGTNDDDLPTADDSTASKSDGDDEADAAADIDVDAADIDEDADAADDCDGEFDEEEEVDIEESDHVEDPNHPVADKKEVPQRYIGTFAGEVLGKFYNRLVHLTTTYSLLGYHQSPVPEVMDHVSNSVKTRKEVKMMNLLILKLCRQQMSTKADQDKHEAAIISVWWGEYYAFRNKTGDFSNPLMWADDRRFTEPHVWYRVWVLPYTRYFGRTGCFVLSKPTGMTGCERNWRDVKLNCSGLRSKLSPRQNSKLATVQGAYQVAKARREKDGQVRECICILFFACLFHCWTI